MNRRTRRQNLLKPTPRFPRGRWRISVFCLLAWASLHALGQEPVPGDGSGATNAIPQASAPEPAPATTNATEAPPPAATNRYPIITPPRIPVGPSGSTIRSAFSGKFVVPGRTLKLSGPNDGNLTPLPEVWNRTLVFGMNMTQGNSDTLRYALGLDAARARDRDTTRVRARSAYGESEGQKDSENATAMVRHDRHLNRRFYALGDVDWLTDTIADVDYRVLGILSPGMHLIRTERTVCKLELGAGFLSEKKGSEQESFAAGRAAGIAERLFNEHVLGWFSVEYLPKLADPDVFFVNAEAGIVSMLTRGLHLHCTVEDRYDNAPAVDKTSNDLVFTTSVSLKF